MKLELKHLAPYLPYGLKGIDYFQEYKLTRDISCNNVMALVDGDTKLKPILRPLSDLTKEQFSYLHTLLRVHLGKNKRDKMIKEGYGITDLPYFIVEQLFENHFDIFSLIEQNLAIDTNTLNKKL